MLDFVFVAGVQSVQAPLFICSNLRNKGFNVKIIDFRNLLSVNGNTILQEKLFVEEVVNEIKEIGGSKYVGLTISEDNLQYIFDLIKKIKTIGCKVIVGGLYTTKYFDDILEVQEIDHLITGYPTNEIEEIIYGNNTDRLIESKAGFNESINTKLDFNLLFPKQNEIKTPPSFEYSLQHYNSRFGEYNKDSFRQFEYYVSNGCYNKCNFCCRKETPVWRNLDLIKEDLWQLKNLGVNHFTFGADNLFANKKISKEFLSIVKELNVTWSVFHQNTELKDFLLESLVKDAYDSGLVDAQFSLESGSETVLREMNKINNIYFLKHIDVFSNLIKKYPISTTAFFLLGYFGETKKTIEESLEVVRKMNVDSVRLSFGLMLANEFQPDFNRLKELQTIQYGDSLNIDPFFQSTGKRLLTKYIKDNEKIYPNGKENTLELVQYFRELLISDGFKFISKDNNFLVKEGK